MTAGAFDLQAWSKAETHLAEAVALEVDATPLSAIHAAYYAMFHCARAVLLRSTGSAPKKHTAVIGQFGALVKDRTDQLRRAGSDLNRIEAVRIDADYGGGATTAGDAREAVESAVRFLDVCARSFDFPRDDRARHG